MDADRPVMAGRAFWRVRDPIQYIIASLSEYAQRFPQSAASVQQNINEQYGFPHDAPVIGWTVEMYRAAYAQLANLVDAGEAS
jgi:hypothetical protein